MGARFGLGQVELGAAGDDFAAVEKLALVLENDAPAAQMLGGVPVPMYQDAVAAEMAFVLTDGEIRVSSVTTQEILDTEVVGAGAERVQRVVSKGFQTTQEVTVTSTDVQKVEKVSREVRQRMTSEIMYQLASILPPEYRGQYANLEAATEDYLRFPSGSQSNLARAATFGANWAAAPAQG